VIIILHGINQIEDTVGGPPDHTIGSGSTIALLNREGGGRGRNEEEEEEEGGGGGGGVYIICVMQKEDWKEGFVSRYEGHKQGHLRKIDKYSKTILTIITYDYYYYY